MQNTERKVAYFSMEYGLRPDLYIYSGGLGILAGDTLKSCADLGVPVVGVGIMYRDGYFVQTFDDHGWQMDQPKQWRREDVSGLRLLDLSIEVQLRDEKTVKLRIWQYDIVGQGGHVVPLILLDSHFNDNSGRIKEITAELYRSDDLWWRMAQEVVLGWGGVLALQALGYTGVEKLHLNEGHAAFALPCFLKQRGIDLASLTLATIKNHAHYFAFTSHTPVPAGHDRFHWDMAQKVLQPELFDFVSRFGREPGNEHFINLTHIALHAAWVNGVARKHGAVTQAMFPERLGIEYITNGVHAGTWVSQSIAGFLDRHCKNWRQQPEDLLQLQAQRLDAALRLDLWQAHQAAKQTMISAISSRHPQCGFDAKVLTIGFARRAATYKRSDLILSEPEQLLKIANELGPIQLVFAGKAHPRDDGGKQILQRIIQKASECSAATNIRVVFIEDYDMTWGQLLTSGCDIWLNNPVPPLEASGTSGMKAALNAVPQLSTADGWWMEGSYADRTGWTFGQVPVSEALPTEFRYKEDAVNLYYYLPEIVRMYYQAFGTEQTVVQSAWMDKMLDALSLNGAQFNTHRMVKEYMAKAWVDVLQAVALI